MEPYLDTGIFKDEVLVFTSPSNEQYQVNLKCLSGIRSRDLRQY